MDRAQAGAAPVRAAEAASGTRDREEVKKHLWFLFSPSSKSVNWLQSSCLLMICRKPGGLIPLKSCQTAGIFGCCHILWALGGWSNPSIKINRLSHNWPAFCLHDLDPVLDAVGVTVLSLRQHHGLIAGKKCACLWLQKPWVLELPICSKYLKIRSLEKDSAKKILQPCWNTLKFRFAN